MREAADCASFQKKVNELLIRHRSALDVLSKFQESNARVNRAVAKTVTNCGCLSVNASRQYGGETLEEMKQHSSTHIQGDLCESCRQILEMELGNNLFYLVSLCTLLDLDLSTVLDKEYLKISALGRFNLS
jgi:NTP pyrophosphatase (non-canonical NTP hydrolase)